MTGNSSSEAAQVPHDENVRDLRFTRRQVAYSLAAFATALVVAAFGFVFAYQGVAGSDSSQVHAAESGSHSHAVDDGALNMMSAEDMHE